MIGLHEDGVERTLDLTFPDGSNIRISQDLEWFDGMEVNSVNVLGLPDPDCPRCGIFMIHIDTSCGRLKISGSTPAGQTMHADLRTLEGPADVLGMTPA